LQKAYEIVKENNRKAHDKNKQHYDQKTKERKFDVGDIVYLFCPAKKPGKCQKFRKVWRGPYKIISKLSDLNYRIVDKTEKEMVVHVNRLKKAGNQDLWKTENPKPPRKRKCKESQNNEEEELVLSRPIRIEEGDPQQVPESPRNIANPPQTPPRNITPQRSETPAVDRDQPQQITESTRRDPNYEPSNSPQSRRILDDTPRAPVTRSRARLQLTENNVL
jgi:hypothetical protein